MESSVRKNLSAKVLKDLSSKENRKTRKLLQKARPQLLYLEDLDFINETISELIERGRISKDVSLVKIGAQELSKARSIAKKYQDSYIKRNKRYPTGAHDIENTMGGIHVKNKFGSTVWPKVKKGEAFIFSSFDQIADCKREIIKEFVKTTDAQLAKITRAVDRGHGAGNGLAISAVQSAKALGRIDRALGDNKEAKEQFQTAFSDFMQNAFEEGEITQKIYDDIISLTIDYSQVVTATGEVSATYVPSIRYQDKYSNRVTDKAREKQVKDLIEEFFKQVDAGEIAAMEGSSPLRDKVFAAAITNLIDIKVDKKTGTVKVSLDSKVDPKKVKLKTKGKAESKNKDNTNKQGDIKRRAAQTAKIAGGRRTRATQSTSNMKTLLGILNSRINDTVAANMGSPRLENQTGRFASSVRITEVTKTRQGFPSIGYTYDTTPYQVFESTSGSRFSSVDRDPRSLIDASIREIAQQLAVGRLYTRRV